MKKIWAMPVIDELNLKATMHLPTENIYETDDWFMGDDGRKVVLIGGNGSGPIHEGTVYEDGQN